MYKFNLPIILTEKQIANKRLLEAIPESGKNGKNGKVKPEPPAAPEDTPQPDSDVPVNDNGVVILTVVLLFAFAMDKEVRKWD